MNFSGAEWGKLCVDGAVGSSLTSGLLHDLLLDLVLQVDCLVHDELPHRLLRCGPETRIVGFIKLEGSGP